jgi:succinate-acetate transporter protein
MAEEMRGGPEALQERPRLPEIADPAALGLGGFALTTFMLSVHNAGWAPDLTWVGLAFFYGGLAQFTAGMWEFRNRNTFGATAFSTYGGFWMSLAFFTVLVLFGKVPTAEVLHDQGWFLLAFAIFNTYMMLWSLRTNAGVFAVFLTLEATEILLFVGNLFGFPGIVKVGGYVGVLTALVSWYVSAAVVINSMSSRQVLPLFGTLWPAAPSSDAVAARRV